MQRILSRSLDFLYSGTSTASGLQTDCDYLLVIKTIEAQLLAWMNEWEATFKLIREHNHPLPLSKANVEHIVQRRPHEVTRIVYPLPSSITTMACLSSIRSAFRTLSNARLSIWGTFSVDVTRRLWLVHR